MCVYTAAGRASATRLYIYIYHVLHDMHHIAVACVMDYAWHLITEKSDWQKKHSTGRKFADYDVAIQHAIENIGKQRITLMNQGS